MYVHVSAPPSAAAQELSAKVAELVRILHEENPDISANDIRVGLRLAERELIRGAGQRMALAGGVLALMFGLGIAMFFLKGEGNAPPKVLMIGIAVAVLGILAAVFANRNR